MNKILKITGVGILSACIIGNVGLGSYQLYNYNSQNKKVIKYIDDELERRAKEAEKKNEYQEDGFKVGGTYEIKSTKKISDAYISGKSDELNDKEKETLKMASEILEKVTKDCKNNYEKEVAVYNWIFENVEISGNSTIAIATNSGGGVDNPYGVLKGRKAVCVGFATTFRMFMNMLGMDCHIVHNEGHSWDLVKLDDGEWYQIDLYTDVSGMSRYRNFNMTDDISMGIMGHEWDTSALPAAKGTKYLYAVQNNKKVKNLYKVPKIIKNYLQKKKNNSLFISFEEKIDEKGMALAEYLISNTAMNISMIPNGENKDVSAVWYKGEDDKYILGIYICDYSSSYTNQSAVPKEQRKKMNKVMEEVYGIDIQDPDDNTGDVPTDDDMNTNVTMNEP